MQIREGNHVNLPRVTSPKIKELQDRCKCLEKGGLDGRQPWGPTLQTMNFQVRNCREAPLQAKQQANRQQANVQHENMQQANTLKEPEARIC